MHGVCRLRRNVMQLAGNPGGANRANPLFHPSNGDVNLNDRSPEISGAVQRLAHLGVGEAAMATPTLDIDEVRYACGFR